MMMPAPENDADKPCYLGMRNSGDAVTWRVFELVTNWTEDWFPRWLNFFFTGTSVLVALVLSCIEYGIRWLITPHRYWKRR